MLLSLIIIWQKKQHLENEDLECFNTYQAKTICPNYRSNRIFNLLKLIHTAGGIKREFSPLLDETSSNKFLLRLIRFNFHNFPINIEENDVWQIDVHQFRIIGSKGEHGEPTPEGIHHDDDDFNAIHLIQKTNCSGGINGVYDNQRKLITNTTLTEIMDTVYVWDPYVMHGVSPISPENSKFPAIRDVMVIGYNQIS